MSKMINYVSEIDILLAKIDILPSSTSKNRQNEINKHIRISALRDTPQADSDLPPVWEDFFISTI